VNKLASHDPDSNLIFCLHEKRTAISDSTPGAESRKSKSVSIMASTVRIWRRSRRGTRLKDEMVVALDETGLKRSGKKIKSARRLRDPLSPPFHTNLMWGRRFLQASLLAPLYNFDAESSPRGLPIPTP
jgi:hypothetical protein